MTEAPIDSMIRADEPNLHAAADWLMHSIDVTGVDGSSVAFRLFAGWHWPYPETTGYIIETFYAYAERYERPAFAERATRMAEWLLSLQFPEGAFPGSHVDGHLKPPSIFNSGQIMLGMLAAHGRTGDARFLEAAERCAAWLARVQDDDGLWRRYSYQPTFSPSYNSRVCWPMLLTTQHSGDPTVRRAAVRGLQAIADRALPNGAIREWGFLPGSPAFTHAIAYTIRGLLESADLLDDRRGLGAVAERAALKAFRVFELRKRLASAYDEQWRGRYWGECLTGYCQLALCWMRLYDWTGDARLLNAACKAIDRVTRTQWITPLAPRFMRGAIAGSKPVFGRYLTLSYPNWAAKFLMDAILFRNERWLRLRERGPGA